MQSRENLEQVVLKIVDDDQVPVRLQVGHL